MTNEPIALDTNILIYLHDNSATAKRTKAISLAALNPYIPSQVISEYLNVCRKLLKLTKEDLLIQTAKLFGPCRILPTLPKTLEYAGELIPKYQFQLFDSIIVAAAIQGSCSILYSEDMQHGLVVDTTLKILNPFLEDDVVEHD